MKCLSFSVCVVLMSATWAVGEIIKPASVTIKSESNGNKVIIPLNKIEFVELCEDGVLICTPGFIARINPFPKNDYLKPDRSVTMLLMKTFLAWHNNGYDEEKHSADMKSAVDMTKTGPNKEFYQRVVSLAILESDQEIPCESYSIHPKESPQK